MSPTTNVPAGRPVRQPLGESGQKDADSLIQLRRDVVVRQHGRQLTEVEESAGREPVKAQPKQRHVFVRIHNEFLLTLTTAKHSATPQPAIRAKSDSTVHPRRAP